MSLLSKLKSLVLDPPAEFVFEISEAGIAWTRTANPSAVEWAPLAEGVLNVTPLKDNVQQPEAFAAAVRAIAPPIEGKRRKQRRAALILPDYCGRVAVLDFDTFPSDPHEQLSLVRFRIKRAVPFDIESAVVACYPRKRESNGKIDVTVAVVNMEVAAHYEAPFRAAGFHCGFVTLSALAALSLGAEPGLASASPSMVAKLTGKVLAVSLLEGATLRLFRCVELPEATLEEALDVFAPTFAYCEDELGARPKALHLAGLARVDESAKENLSRELGMPVGLLRSRFGALAPHNAGLFGYLETAEGI